MSTKSCERKSLVYVACILINLYPTLILAYLKTLSPHSPVTEADLHSSLVLHCNISGKSHQKLIWLKDGHALSPDLSWKVHEKQGSIVSQRLEEADAGNYTCQEKDRFGHRELSTQLIIKTPPLKLVNVTVHPSTVVATVRWHVDSDGGYPITHFTLMYRPLESNDSESWHVPPVHISPSVRQFFVSQLKPGTDYIFRLWGNNKLGPGEPFTVYASTAKPINAPEVLQHMMGNAESFSSDAWIVAISMVLTTVLVLSCLSCILIYKEGRNEAAVEQEPTARIITNPGFDIDLEECYLLDHADYNDNTERTVRINNNTVVQPSRV